MRIAGKVRRTAPGGNAERAWLRDIDDLDTRISFAREHSPVEFLTSLVRSVIMRVTRALSLALTPPSEPLTNRTLVRTMGGSRLRPRVRVCRVFANRPEAGYNNCWKTSL